MWLPYRGFIVWNFFIFLILGTFLFFVWFGWPGSPDSCLDSNPDHCYCEFYVLNDIIMHAPGVRQPVNSWFNLYAIVTSFIVALYVYLDRVDLVAAGSSAQNVVIRSGNLIADVYIFAVLFLGLGSMWFHASLTKSVSWMDGLSMYVFAAYLVFYTIRRIWDANWFFWIFYPLTVAGFTVIGILWSYHLASAILIGILVVIYLVLEVVAWRVSGHFLIGGKKARWLWGLGVFSMLLAVLFWLLSQTGGLLCSSGSFFQPHGLLWHPLAGVMAVLLYFYWREEKPQ